MGPECLLQKAEVGVVGGWWGVSTEKQGWPRRLGGEAGRNVGPHGSGVGGMNGSQLQH